MKNQLLILLSLSFLLFSSCKKEEKDSHPGATIYSNTFTLKKDGVPFSAGQISVTSSDSSEYIGIQAHLNSNQVNIQTYSMSLYKDIQPGTYNESNSANSLSDVCAFVHIYNELQVFVMEDGEITVLSNDTAAKIIEFDFRLELHESVGPGIVHITEGHCKANY